LTTRPSIGGYLLTNKYKTQTAAGSKGKIRKGISHRSKIRWAIPFGVVTNQILVGIGMVWRFRCRNMLSSSCQSCWKSESDDFLAEMADYFQAKTQWCYKSRWVYT
jgi:hypothetical protein